MAIKLFPWAVGEVPAAITAFAREAGRVSILRHPRIAQVLDSGVLPDRTPFVAMEFLPGQTLEELLVRRGPLTISQAFTVIRDIVLGLSAAHEAGVVHREIRPDNIFLVGRADTELGFVKLLDFGVSQLTWAAQVPGQGITVDAARYLAPEQVRRGLIGVDVRADEYALAVLTYRMLRGPDPFLGPAIARASAVDNVLGRALSESPGERYASVGAFFRAFEEAIISSVSTPAPTEKRGGNSGVTVVTVSDKSVTREVALMADPEPQPTPPPREVIRQVAPAREVIREIAREVIRETAPAREVIRETAPAREAIRRTAPAREEIRRTAPAREEIRRMAPAREEIRETAPSAREEIWRTAPAREEIRRTVPAREEIRETAPAREEIHGEATLAERFFEEGDRYEQQNRWQNAPAALQHRSHVSELSFTSFDRVPRRRTPLAMVLLVAAVAGVGFAGQRFGWRSPRAVWDESGLGRTVYLFRAGLPWNPDVVGAASSDRPETRVEAPPAPAATAAPPAVAAPPVPTPPVVAEPPAGTELPVVAEPPGGTESPVAAEPAGVVAPKVRAGAGEGEGEPSALVAPPVPPPGEGPPVQPGSAPASHQEPGSALRGYVWSPRERRLVPAPR